MKYLLCVYLVFKGIEIFQIALMSNRENRTIGMALGIIMIIASIIAASYFIFTIDIQAKSVSDGMKGIR